MHYCKGTFIKDDVGGGTDGICVVYVGSVLGQDFL